MDDAAAQSRDLLERLIEIVDCEIRQREAVPGSATADMDADSGTGSAGLPTLPFAVCASVEIGTEKSRPEPPRSIRIVGGELDQR